MNTVKTPLDLCIEACNECALQCSGCAFQGEMMGGMVEASRLARECSTACFELEKQLRDGQQTGAESCSSVCRRFIPEAESVFRHLASFKQAAVAAQTMIDRMNDLTQIETEHS